MSVLVTDGVGFMGGNFVLGWLAESDEPVINLDKLTCAGNIENLQGLDGDCRHVFVQGGIGDSVLVTKLLAKHQPHAIINFAAESHVDRSIYSSQGFTQTDIIGTVHLLEAVPAYWGRLQGNAKQDFRFFHVSTDEVCGSLTKLESAFTETHRYEPNSPIQRVKQPVITWCVPTITPIGGGPNWRGLQCRFLERETQH